MKVLIFGGAGFVGLNIAEALAARGDEVIIFDRHAPAIETLRFVQGDVRDAGVEIEDDVDSVIWGAAITANAERDASEPERIIETNLGALPRILRKARDAGVRRFVNLSSVAAYGEAAFGTRALKEDDPADPRALYALTKFASERLCARLAELWAFDALSVRLSAVFGPWERASEARDTPSPFLRVMALAGRGEPVRLPRAGVRDWIYAPDVAKAVLALLDAPRLAHRLYNVGPGRVFSVLDWARSLPQVSVTIATPANVDFGGERDRSSLSIERLHGETGFQPQYGMRESVEHLRAWARAHPGWFT